MKGRHDARGRERARDDGARALKPLAPISLTFATGNTGKLTELRQLYSDNSGGGVDVVGTDELRAAGIELPEVAEDADTFIGNALLKAISAYKVTGKDALADDSGLCVDALAGAPGVHSARFAGPDGDAEANTTLLLQRMADVPAGLRGAGFECALVLVGPLADGVGCGRTEDGLAWRAFVGTTRGHIAHERAGEAGFGYDPVFVSDVLGTTFAQATAAAKNAVSHRGAAFSRLKAYLDVVRADVAKGERPMFLRAVGMNALAQAIDEVLRGGLRYADKAMESALRAHPELGGKERAAVAQMYWHTLRQLDRLEVAIAVSKGVTVPETPDPRRLSGRDAGLLAALAATDVDLSGVPVAHGKRAATTVLAGLLDRNKQFAGHLPMPPEALAKAHRKAVGIGRISRANTGRRGGFHAAFEQACRAQLGDEHAELALDYLDTRGPLTLRVNTRRADIDKVATDLLSVGIRTVQTGELALTCVDSARVTRTAGYKAGEFEIQDAGSQEIAAAVAAEPGETVLDWCAGAGGKTLALAARMAGRGQLIALDVHRGRLAECRRRLRRAGEMDMQVLEHRRDPRMDRRLPRADAVLVDAPCSSSGALRRTPELRWHLDTEWLDRFAGQQLAILRSASRYVRPGGRLIYATCSILDAENAGVVQAFLAVAKGWTCLREQRVGPANLVWLQARPLARIGPDGFYFATLHAPADLPASDGTVDPQ